MLEGSSALTLNPPVRTPYRFPAPRPAQRPAYVDKPAVSGERAPGLPAAASIPGHSRRAVSARPAMKLRFGTVALFACAMTVLLFIVYSYMELSQLNSACQSGAAELLALQKEENILSRRAEANLSLGEVEAYAIGELGMVKPARDQIVYISFPGEDHAEVVPQKGFWGSVKQLFSVMTGKVVEFLD